MRDREGRLVGTGFYNPRAELALRMFSDGEVKQRGDTHFVEALEARRSRLRDGDPAGTRGSPTPTGWCMPKPTGSPA